MERNELGIIGLGVMGANLARNTARNGARVALYNRTKSKTDDFMAKFESEGEFVACGSVRDLVSALAPPRAVLLMVNAGDAVDAVIGEIVPYSQKGDIVIDGGNSHFRDTERRSLALAEKGIRFLGMGVSGGAEGALRGPSLMPGGDKSAYEELEMLLRTMAADDGDGGRCVAYMGPGGAGHFVKMVHNGIEYAVMQLIAESYDLLKHVGMLSNAELAAAFSHWNDGDDLKSFLMEITAEIFKKSDDHGDGDLIDMIKDAAAQKGTGKWTTEAAMHLGVPIPTINAAVDARILSGDAKKRDARYVERFPFEPDEPYAKLRSNRVTTQVRAALYCSAICAHNQGFQLMEFASDEYGWDVDLGQIARIWRRGCIIRSKLLEKFERACAREADDGHAHEIVNELSGSRQADWRSVVEFSAAYGIPAPAIAASLSYYDSIRRDRLPQNLIQAQRDFFGAHGYERIDRAGTFHTEWSEGSLA